VSDGRKITLEVSSDETLSPLHASFSNFVQISRVATEVQFEFLFVDINHVALSIEKARGSSEKEPVKLSGVPIAKVVVPAFNFLQLREHINQMFDAIEREFGITSNAKEAQHGSGRTARS
jgi:hypothetical protein